MAMCMGNRTPVTDIVGCEEDWKYHYHWLAVQAKVGSSECIRLLPLIARGTRIRSWLLSPIFKAKQLIRDFTDLQCVLIKNCLPQTVQAVICRLVCLTDTGWGGERLDCFRRCYLSSIDGLICCDYLPYVGSPYHPIHSLPGGLTAFWKKYINFCPGVYTINLKLSSNNRK